MTPSNTNAQSLLKRYEFKLLRSRQTWLLTVACLAAGSAIAQGAPETKPAPAQQNTPQGQQASEKSPPDSVKLRYTYGIRLQVSEDTGGKVKAKFKPELGFKYGRWSVGTNADVQAWLGKQMYQRDPTVAYDAITNERLRVVLGLRLQNVSTGTRFIALESGRLTLRARLLASYQLTPAWTVLGEFTQDLQNRGDASTFSVGASRIWTLGARDQMSVGTSLKWAAAEHWRTPYVLNPNTSSAVLAQAQGLTSGFGALGLGWEYRHKLNEKTVLLSGVSVSQSIGQMADLNGSKPSLGAQVGILWFGNW